MIWGGVVPYTYNYFSSGGIYNPATDSWTSIANPNPLFNIAGRSYHSAIWTGTQMICWGGYRDGTATGNTTHCNGITYDKPTYYNDGLKYTPATGAYAHMSNIGIEKRRFHGSVWTGTEMIIWGGGSYSETPTETEYVDYNYNVTYDCSTTGNYLSYKSGVKFTPSASTVTNLPTPASLPKSEEGYLIYNGSKVIAINGSNKLYQYDPVTNTWDLNAIPDCPVGVSHNQYTNSLVWTGNKYVFMYCGNQKMYGYALSPNSPVTINTIAGSVSKNLYLYKKI